MQFLPPCERKNSSCECNEEKFAPICGSDGNNYFSACHAGCKNATKVNGKTIYSNCECIPEGEI